MARFKSLKETRWTRFRAFLRGVLLYNTVYWNRASDGVNREASRLARGERERHRPQIDPELLRPRAPRPGGGEATKPGPGEEHPRRSDVPMPRLAMPAGEELFRGHLPDAADGLREFDESRSHRRRRVLRRRELRDKAVDPGRVLRSRAEGKVKRPMPGWLRWLIGWHH